MSEYGPYVNEEDALDAYRTWLDEIYPRVEFGYLGYDASRVLEAVDEIAFQTEFNDWLDEKITEYEEEMGD